MGGVYHFLGTDGEAKPNRLYPVNRPCCRSATGGRDAVVTTPLLLLLKYSALFRVHTRGWLLLNVSLQRFRLELGIRVKVGRLDILEVAVGRHFQLGAGIVVGYYQSLRVHLQCRNCPHL